MNEKKKRALAMEEKQQQDDEELMDLHLPFPFHVVTQILVLLPLPCLAQLHLVCRSWNSLLCSSYFRSLLMESFSSSSSSSSVHKYSSECWFVMASSPPLHHPFVAYSSSFGPWTPFRLPLHPPLSPTSLSLQELLPKIAFSHSLIPSVVNMLVASAGGLICFVIKGTCNSFIAHHDNSDNPAIALFHHGSAELPYGDRLAAQLDYDVFVFNFLTGYVRRLQPRPFRLSQKLVSSCAISMSADPSTNSYRVILSDLKYRDLEIYDSKRHCWTTGVGIRRNSADVSYNARMANLLDGDLIRYNHKGGVLAAYNAETNLWVKVEVLPPRCVDPPVELLRETVIKCKGRLLLVACLMQHAVEMKGFGIWELRFCAGTGNFCWEEVSRTPEETMKAFKVTNFDIYDCRFVGHGDTICMTGTHYTIGGKREAQYWPPIIYDLARDQWQRLPRYKHAKDFLCVFPFEPTFHAAV